MQHESLNVVVYLNRGGLVDDTHPLPLDKGLEYKVPPGTLKTHLIQQVTFRFDPGNPRAMIRENREATKAVICVQSTDFELSPQWFGRELRSALGAKSRVPVKELEDGHADKHGEALCVATRSFLAFIGDELNKMDLAVAEPHRRFGPRLNGGSESLKLDLSRPSQVSADDHETLLRLWWLSLDCVRRGIDRALHRRLLANDQDTRGIRTPVLKLQAHLAASLLELGAADDVNLAPALHESMLRWIDSNLGARRRHEQDDVGDTLEQRHRELGELLFTVEGGASGNRWVRMLRADRLPRESLDWRHSQRLAVRPAILAARQASSAIADHYADSLRRAGDLFSRRYDIRELITVTRAWYEIRSSSPGRAALGKGREIVRDTLRHLPWQYPAFLLFAVLPWVSLAALVCMHSKELIAWEKVTPANAAAYFGTPAHSIVSVLFSVQFFLIYAVLVFCLAPVSPIRWRRLFEQAMPRLLGSLIVGYVPLWLAEEAWTFPYHLRWRAILPCVIVLLIVSFLYFLVDASRRVKEPREAALKAMAVFVIAATYAYCLGLLITDFSANSFMRAMPFADEGKLLKMFVAHRQILNVPSPFRVFPWPVAFKEHEFLLLPKVVVFWFGVAMFLSVFLHMLWEKEGILERR